MIFRAFHGEMCPEAEELSHGHLYHAPEPTNPATGEVEDTDIGFPGPEHHIAERARADEDRDGRAGACWRSSAASCRSRASRPSCTTSSSRRSRTPSSTQTLEPTATAEWIGLVVGAVIGLAGIGIAWRIYGQGGNAAALPGALRARLHKFFVNKWYFDEVIDFLIVRPFAWLGRFANSTFERVFVNGALVGGSHRRGARAVGRGARHPVGLPALLRRAAARRAHRPERLLPDLRMIHL